MTAETLLPAEPWWRRESILVAASGGLDSIVLLDLIDLHRCGHGWPARLGAACFDHGWRLGEGRHDAALVERFCASRGVEFFAGCTAEVATRRRLSPEAAARRERYGFLAATARRAGFAAVATAHHANDQAETVLLRAARGGRLEGLGAIAPAATVAGVEVLRPLLDVAQAALVAHAERRGLPFREDATNADTRFTRNRLRAAVAGRLDPAAAATVARLHRLRRRLLEGAATAVLRETVAAEGPGVRVDIERLRGFPSSLRREVLRAAFHRVAPPERRLPERALDAVERLMIGGTGGSVHLPDARVHVSCGSAVLGPPDVLPSVGAFDELVESFDAADVRGPLVVRAWRPGDRVTLGESGGRKKVKDLFRESRVPAWERGAWPIVADAEGVLWVPRLRRAARARPRAGRPAYSVGVARGGGSGEWCWRVELA